MTDKLPELTIEDFKKITTREELNQILEQKNIDVDIIMKSVDYEADLRKLQIELVKLQQSISKKYLISSSVSRTLKEEVPGLKCLIEITL